jgi:hypothetical protein
MTRASLLDGLRKVAIGLLGLLALLSIAIAVYPDPPARPLVKADEIFIGSGFTPTTKPQEHEVRVSILRSPELALWRTWSPERGAVPGEAHTKPFRLPAHIVVPYQGFAGSGDIRLFVQCLGSGATLDVATARTNNQWSEALVSRPSGWCKGDSRLVATSNSKGYFLAFGTPFRISTISWLKTQWIGLFGIGLLLFAAVAGCCLATALAWRRLRQRGDELAPGLIGMGVIGYAMFFLFYFSYPAAAVVSASLAVIGLATFGATIWIARAGPRMAVSAPHWIEPVLKAWRAPLLGWGLVFFAYVLLVFAADNGAGAWLVNSRFAPVRWSTDNQMPMLIGEYLARLNLDDLDLRPWLVSDRTPLSYGLHAWLRTLSLWLTRGNDGFYSAPYIHTLIGIALNTAWVPVFIHVLKGLGLRAKTLGLAVATAALLPFCIFNSVYIWPKLLGGSFGLLAIWVLLLRPRDESPDAGTDDRWVQAALLSALALLSHGGTVFGIIAMLMLAPFAGRLPKLRTVIAAGACALALLAPWAAWQKLVQPPGNALLKGLLAGTYGFDETSMSVLDTVRRSYASLGVDQWFGMKLDGLRSLILPPSPTTCSYGEMITGTNGIDTWRIVDFVSLVPSLKFLWLGLAVLLVAAVKKRNPALKPVVLLLAAGVTGVAVELALAWDCHIIHTQSYQSILAIVAAMLVLLLSVAPRWLGLAAVAASLAYGLIVWIVDPFTEALRLDPLALFAGLALLVAFVAWLRAPYNSRQLPVDPQNE